MLINDIFYTNPLFGSLSTQLPNTKFTNLSVGISQSEVPYYSNNSFMSTVDKLYKPNIELDYYSDGYQAGFEKGSKEGFEEGRKQTIQEYEQALIDAFNQGYQEGFDDGHKDGYEQGLNFKMVF